MFRSLLISAGLAALLLVIHPATSKAGTVILEGSDAIGFHCPTGTPGDGAECDYKNQVWSAIGGTSSLPIAVIGGAYTITGATHAIENYATVADAAAAYSGGLDAFVALYLAVNDGSGCCSENDATVTAAGALASLESYLGDGGTVMIQNYTGGAAYDGIVGTTGGAASGNIVSSGCGSDAETVTLDGAANGFTTPGVVGCWEHQAYDYSYFSGLGFSHNFYNAGPEMIPGGSTDIWSGLLATGLTVTGAPEPGTWLMMATGIGAVLFGLKRRKA